MNPNSTQPLPSVPQLVRATAVALSVAAALLVSVILPAEYGIDPVGVGNALGLTRTRASAGTKPAEPAPAQPPELLVQRTAPFRSDEVSTVLPPVADVEIKAAMEKSDRFVYSWTAEGGSLDFDMHGEEFQAPAGEFTSYSKKPQQSADYGAFVAPFAGVHGWYWRNRGARPVTIRVKTSGFYKKIAKQ